MYLLRGKIDYPLNMLLIRIVLPCFILIEYCTGCGRSSNQPKSQGHTATNGQVEMPGNHRLKCTENETQTIACRNGGTCFATYIDYRFARCACLKKYTGKFCEMIDINIIFKRKREEKTTNAGLVAGIITIVLLLTVIIIVLICKKKYKKEKKYRMSDRNAKGTDQSEIKCSDEFLKKI